MEHMKGRFNNTHKVPYEGIRPDLTLSFSKLMSILQETAISHSNSTISPMSWYVENNLGFLLTNWDVRVNKYPALYEDITVYTWPVSFKGIMAQRSFQAYDNAGCEVASANTRWVFADLAKRRPTKIPAELAETYGSTFETPYEPDYAFPSLDGYEFLSAMPHTALRNDIDSNFHVNNIKYIEWAANCVPQEIYSSGNVCEMKTQYKKELKLNDRVLIETYVKGSEIITLIKSVEDSEVLHAGIYTKWRNGI